MGVDCGAMEGAEDQRKIVAPLVVASPAEEERPSGPGHCFPTFNRHLYKDELSGLGWRDVEDLTANPAKDNDARDESFASLYTAEYRAIFQRALDGEALDILREAHTK
ncbi:hypothetical protein COCSUDRAFT_66275 [Coccomyxa subellipsoidea C-169]|uniref:Uncharacterized protein n=1 Tax=Coccomyxa subellipsoidea (strain C-169) TaxID=574566 RepID=I0YVX2_COCSC|nr:hypothetical protein COCSUDRAFT_66275 [Coccomyxa subellipsoidea C-169]EIE22541.1 hypothetical protein COCSUDRAFT_66275 [Coccomyxa subellipsoidea C-169]|eukprot:XP_005647085.1 hypothetical protein COCSUDRAFT_66275 [Coccomyxa subellipsoidea C-169]